MMPLASENKNVGHGSNMLPQEYEKQEDDFDFFEMGEAEVKKQV